MMIDSNNLGPAASWHIRSIPEGIRQAVVDRAHAKRISVGELLTRMVTHAGDMGDALGPRGTSVTHAGAVFDAATNAVDEGDTVDVVAHAVDANKILTLLQAAEMVDKVNLPRGTQGSTRAMIAAELRAMRRTQLPPKRAQLTLSAPAATE